MLILAAGFLGFLAALTTAKWQPPLTLLIVFSLLLVVDFFPIRFHRITYSFAFPLIYSLILIADFAAAAVLSSLSTVVVQYMRQRPYKTIMLNASSRILAMLLTGCLVDAILTWIGLDPSQITPDALADRLLHLVLTVMSFTVCSTLIVMWSFRMHTEPQRRILYNMALLTIVLGCAYNGLMLWLASDPRHNEAGDIGILFFFAPLLAAAVVLHLINHLAHAKSGLETLFIVSQSINHQDELPKVLSQVIHKATRLVDGAWGMMYMVQEDGSLKRTVGTALELAVERIPRGQGLAGAVAASGEALIVHDLSRDPRSQPPMVHLPVRSMMIVPIPIDGRVAGVISIGKRDTYSFSVDDLRLMQIFASHAAVAIQNALYIEEREKRLLVEERNRLAREIHDGIAQDLAGALLHLEMMKRADHQQMMDGLGEVQELLRKTVSTVRHSIFSLRPAPYTHVGLIPAIRAHLDEVESQHGLTTHFSGDLPGHPLPPKLSDAIFKIVRESVQNVIKHANATDLYIALKADDKRVTLTVRDNGVGFSFGQAILRAAERRSFGIENLHHLADQVGGTLDFLTAPGHGTLITFEAALNEEGEDDEHSRTVM
jgi:signal transduction histidine kinase